jgi:tRNA-2-methylthio-N6-dimethylallyladenosine synthase
MPDDVPEVEKTRRIMALQALQREVQSAVYSARVGATATVLVDTVSSHGELGGRTAGNMVVNFAGPASWLGRIIRVRVTSASPFQLRAEAIGAEPGSDRLEAANVD